MKSNSFLREYYSIFFSCWTGGECFIILFGEVYAKSAVFSGGIKGGAGMEECGK